MAGYFYCSDYTCYENLISGLISLYYLYLYLRAFKIIQADRNQNLEKLEKTQFMIALIQVRYDRNTLIINNTY